MKLNFDVTQYDLFIVDFDGTVVDTMEMWRHICPNFILSMNKTPEEDIYLKITSKTNIEIAYYVRDEYFPEYSREEIVELFFEFIKGEYAKQNIKPNATLLLEELNKHGKVVLYSATASKVLNVLLDKFDLRKYFEGIYSGSDLGLTKRDGSGYLEVAKMCKGDNILVLEDALHAIIGARSKNLDVLAILDYSNRYLIEKVKEYATYILDLDEYKE